MADSTERFLRSSGLKEGMRCLDAGCGVGVVSRKLAEITGHCHGIDLDSQFLEIAQKDSLPRAGTRYQEISRRFEARRTSSSRGRRLSRPRPSPALSCFSELSGALSKGGPQERRRPLSGSEALFAGARLQPRIGRDGIGRFPAISRPWETSRRTDVGARSESPNRWRSGRGRRVGELASGPTRFRRQRKKLHEYRPDLSNQSEKTSDTR